ncbi:CD151 antigen-like [Dysidea avara]|uniref:CD151 antigen-like n=1 Tax=Dysidea avara TaxID=196820 RepID=UPI00331C968A
MRLPGSCVRAASFATLTISTLLSTISSLVIGILLLTDYDDYEDLSSGGTYAKAVAWVLIVNSIVSFVGGIIGCFGLRLANRCLLSLYTLLGIVVVILEIAPSTLYFVASQNEHEMLGGHIHHELYTAVIEFDAHSEQDATNLVNKLQIEEACCGIDGYKDWRRYDTSWSNETPDMSIVVPRSCCQAQARNGESCNIEGTELEINRGGCFKKLLDRHQHLAELTLGFCIASVIFEVLSRLFSFKTLYILWYIERRQGYRVV